MAEFTVSGDAKNIYVSDYSGRIVAMCPTLDDAERVAEALNMLDAKENFRPFGRLDPDDPIDQAMVKAFNKGAKVRYEPVATDDPEFYCHGPQCIADGCSPLRCKDEENRDGWAAVNKQSPTASQPERTE